MTSAPGSLFMREGYAEIDHQPGARPGRTEAIEIDVHADLAETAERHEYEFVWSGISRSLRWCAFAHGVPSRAVCQRADIAVADFFEGAINVGTQRAGFGQAPISCR